MLSGSKLVPLVYVGLQLLLSLLGWLVAGAGLF
jgi:hypothetical protein